MNYPQSAQTKVLDLLFSTKTGAGLSIVRNLLPTLDSFPRVYDWNRDADQRWFMERAKERGATRFITSTWSPPRYMKDTFRWNGGRLQSIFYAPFANYLADYVEGYRDRFNLDIYAISPANEPEVNTTDYDSTAWRPTELRGFIRFFMGPVFDQRHIQAKIFMPETGYWSEGYALDTLNDPDASQYVDIVAAHGYFDAWDPAKFTVSLSQNKTIWQTEMSEFVPNDPSITSGLKWAKGVHNHLTRAEVNAWLYWWAVTEKTNEEGLINLDVANQTYTVSKRLFTLGNFSRFIRPDWNRIGTKTNSVEGLYVSAYKDSATKEFAVVVINDTSVDRAVALALDGFSARSVTPYTTSATMNLQPGTPAKTSKGSIDATVDAKSVVTFVGTAG